jgi:acyl dehydratase
MQQGWAELVGTPVAPAVFSWTPRTVALYHLGLGISPVSERELGYLLEGSMRVLPTFATLTCFPALIHLDEVPGLGHVDLAQVLHGAHALELSGSIPPTGSVTTHGEIVGVAAHRSNLHVTVEQRSRTPDGVLGWTNRYTMVCRGAAEVDPIGGRSGSESGIRARNTDAGRAERLDPAIRVDTVLASNLAYLYRQSGDDNPLHTDPAYARRGGFDKPILQGLCTLGVATRAVVDAILDVPDFVRRVAVRFSDIVLPGTTLSTVMRASNTGVEFEAFVGDRRVLDGGVIEVEAASGGE